VVGGENASLDGPEFARFLADAGIDSVSVTPDAFAEVVSALR
jgi:phosphoenolpyruvate synthase/pyruvate phosphate dikinase